MIGNMIINQNIKIKKTKAITHKCLLQFYFSLLNYVICQEIQYININNQKYTAPSSKNEIV